MRLQLPKLGNDDKEAKALRSDIIDLPDGQEDDEKVFQY